MSQGKRAGSAASLEMTHVHVEADAGRRNYDVCVARGLLDHVGALATEAAPGVRQWAIISDETVAELYGERVQASFDAMGARPALFTFPAGEAHKNRSAWAGLSDALLGEGLARDGGVIALGGGVTGDLAGFVAATFQRGIPVVQVPTSIVAMVDSAVGGKTGVDTPAGKNLVGAFHPPARVVVDPECVATLPRVERSQGLAEAIKHGAIADAAYFDALLRDAPALLDAQPDLVMQMVLRSIELKASVVSRDERESGLREVLNFGHTLGHALEAASGLALPHGSAVSIGMVLEAELGCQLGLTSAEVPARLREALQAAELPVAVPGECSAESVLAFTRSDKKARSGKVRYVLLSRIGAVAGDGSKWAHEVEPGRVQALLLEQCGRAV